KKDEPQRFAWDGTKQDGPTLLKEIAAARVSMDVEGDLGVVEKTLDDLWLRSCEVHGFDGQAEALVQVALARAELYKRLGQRAKALEAMRQLLIERLPKDRNLDMKVVPASSQILVTMATASGDKRIADYRFELQQEAGGSASKAQQSLD